ncbi:19216_t:CDS:1, partial [Racocetra fulgida]
SISCVATMDEKWEITAFAMINDRISKERLLKERRSDEGIGKELDAAKTTT